MELRDEDGAMDHRAVRIIAQSSCVARAPWSLAPGAPKDAHVFAGYANLRYVLP